MKLVRLATTVVVTRWERRMYGAMKRHEIQVLRRAGVTIRKIAEQAGVSPSTIKRIVREPAVEIVSDSQLASKHGTKEVSYEA